VHTGSPARTFATQSFWSVPGFQRSGTRLARLALPARSGALDSVDL
jgi:hypothetical protein